jgi:hypothetical protein
MIQARSDLRERLAALGEHRKKLATGVAPLLADQRLLKNHVFEFGVGFYFLDQLDPVLPPSRKLKLKSDDFAVPRAGNVVVLGPFLARPYDWLWTAF